MGKQRPTVLDRLLSNTAAGPGGCVIWTGSLLKSGGYGQISVNNGSRRVHRVAYELLVGPIPAGMVIDHTCHNRDKSCPGGECLHRRCLNPHHLEPVTNAENASRSRHALSTKNANKEECDAGHPFDADNTYIRIDTGGRMCRKCAHGRGEQLRRAQGVPTRAERTASRQATRRIGEEVVEALYLELGRRPNSAEVIAALQASTYPYSSKEIARILRIRVEAAHPEFADRSNTTAPHPSSFPASYHTWGRRH